MVDFIMGLRRDSTTLFPDRLEDWIGEVDRVDRQETSAARAERAAHLIG